MKTINQEKYIENIQMLDFQLENQKNSSVFLVNQLKNYIKKKEVSSYILVALDKAKVFEADAVYFRFFDDNRPPLAQIYIYDNITKQQTTEYYAEKHRAIWSSCSVVSFLIIDKDTIRIYDSRNPVEINNDKIISNPIDTINLLSEYDDILRKYKSESFDNGSFWENENAKRHFLNSKVASERLVKGLKNIRANLHAKNKLSANSVDKLLIVCILIKYLEETGEDKEKKINLAKVFFKENTNYSDLENIIRNNQLSCLLSALSKHFNGGIFNIDASFKQELDNTDISSLAEFFEANYKTNLFGWREYSFEHIPVELISNFYEEFIPKTDSNKESKNKKDTGAVYTPSFLVNLLIDECLPLDNNNLEENIKIIDPACGSGIFLVSAYKRLVQRWRIKNKLVTDTTTDILKNILSKNIFGVDVNSHSVNLSIFSLQLALCSMLTPKQIWTELQFSDLQKDGNIVQRDFFEYLIDSNTKYDFDLVIGNPPFVSKGKKLDGKSYKDYQNLLPKEFEIKFKNPQKEFAFLFLEKAMHLLKEKRGKLCLILPSGPLLYTDDSVKIREQLFSTYNVSQVIDFTFLRRVLFQATVASLAIFVEYAPPTDLPVLHITAKRTKQSKERFYFEFDHYDFYNVPKKLVVDKINIWKCNLYGGYRVYDIVEKLNKIKPKLKDWCSTNDVKYYGNVRENDLFCGVEKKVNQTMSLFEEEQFVPKKKQDCWGIKKNITKGTFPIEVQDIDFKKNIFDGIEFKSSSNNIEFLKKYFKEYADIICFYISSTSGRQGIRSPYVFELDDLMNFPVVDNFENIITHFDKIVINDAVKYTLEEFGNGEKSFINTSAAKQKELIDFCHIYCSALNNYYDINNHKYKLTDIIIGEAYYVCEIHYTDREVSQITTTETEKTLNNLLAENLSQSQKINKMLRFYGNNVIRIVKPKQQRFWLQSKALRDADETFKDILTH
jgi:Type I restriction-modification system methyltransferase subunit